MKKSIIEKVTQLCLIVFSVVLGLYLSERIEDRKNDKEATKLLSKIKSELNENKILLDSWVPYHAEIVEKLDSFSKSEIFVKDFIADKTEIYKAFSKGTIMGETPSNDAWDIAKSHPLIVNVDYDKLLSLSKIFKQQKITYDLLPKLIEKLMSSDINHKENAVSNLQLLKDMMQDITNREMQLLVYYNKAEDVLHYSKE